MTQLPQVNEREAAFQQQSWRDAESPGGFGELLDLLCERGFEGMSRAMHVLFNEAMKLERMAARFYGLPAQAQRKAKPPGPMETPK